MAQLDWIERISLSGVPVYNFDWRDPHNMYEWRPEWKLVLEGLKQKRGEAQNDAVAQLYDVAWRVLTNSNYIKPDTIANIMARAVDCMEAHMSGSEGSNEFQSWVCTCIREVMHDVFKNETVWLDPKYAEPAF